MASSSSLTIVVVIIIGSHDTQGINMSGDIFWLPEEEVKPTSITNLLSFSS